MYGLPTDPTLSELFHGLTSISLFKRFMCTHVTYETFHDVISNKDSKYIES